MARGSTLLLALALAACVEDNGMVDGRCGPLVLPEEVVNLDGTVDAAVLSEGVALWNAASILPLFVEVPEATEVYGWATLAVAPLPGDLAEEAAAAAWVTVSERGEVLYCEILISPDYIYHRPTYVRTVAHELGHCLGLDDDPESLDLGSIMSDPPHHGARPTEHDVDLVLRGCDAD